MHEGPVRYPGARQLQRVGSGCSWPQSRARAGHGARQGGQIWLACMALLEEGSATAAGCRVRGMHRRIAAAGLEVAAFACETSLAGEEGHAVMASCECATSPGHMSGHLMSHWGMRSGSAPRGVCLAKLQLQGLASACSFLPCAASGFTSLLGVAFQ